MVTSELGNCEWFVYELRRSNLIDRGQLDQVVGEFLKRNPRAEAPALAEYLVLHGNLSQFQAERILQGKTQGLVLGPYTLCDSIGAGSMGQVYKAQSKTDNKCYAVKVLPRRSMWNVRLARRQVRAFGQFEHPTVVPFVDVGTSGGLHYLVWPLVEGETLETVVLRQGKLAPAQAAFVALQIAQGLAVSHQNGLFHGLLKPSNIMVHPDLTATILDFGIGSLLAENDGESLVDTMSTANTLTSGLDCASPESIMEPTNRTQPGDQYSLGCIVYFCLTGRYPFPEGTAVEKMMAHQFKQPQPVGELAPGTPTDLIAVIDKLMHKSPEQRYADAAEVVEVLEPLAASAQPSRRPSAAPVPTAQPRLGAGSAARMNPQPAPAPPGPAPYSAPASPGRAGAPNLPTRGSIRQNAIAAPVAEFAPELETEFAHPVPQYISERTGMNPIFVAVCGLLIGAGLCILAMRFLQQ